MVYRVYQRNAVDFIFLKKLKEMYAYWIKILEFSFGIFIFYYTYVENIRFCELLKTFSNTKICGLDNWYQYNKCPVKKQTHFCSFVWFGHFSKLKMMPKPSEAWWMIPFPSKARLISVSQGRPSNSKYKKLKISYLLCFTKSL